MLLLPALAVALSPLLSLIGCGKGSDPAKASTQPPESFHEPVRGSLITAYSELAATPGWDAGCDGPRETAVRDLLNRLDGLKNEINRASVTPVSTPASEQKPEQRYARLVKLGPVNALEAVPPLQPEHRGFGTREESWSLVFAAYAEAQGKAITDPRWKQVDMLARSMVRNDQMRLRDLRNLALDETSAPGMRSLALAYQDCRDRVDCPEPRLDTRAKEFLAGNPIQSEIWRTLQGLPSLAEKHRLLERLLQELPDGRKGRVLADYAAVAMRALPSVRRRNAETFEVALDANDLREGRAELTRLIESVWQSDRYHVEVRWVTPPTTDALFRFVAEPDANVRSFVLHSDQTIHLPSRTEAKVVAHEVGHALGFPDHYYTVWDASACRYAVRLSEEDVMSYHPTGGATAEDWAELNETYPFK